MEAIPDVAIYTEGLCFASCCVKKGLTRKQINAQLPVSGTSHGWQVSRKRKFHSGEPNPTPCNDHPAERMHYLLVC